MHSIAIIIMFCVQQIKAGIVPTPEEVPMKLAWEVKEITTGPIWATTDNPDLELKMGIAGHHEGQIILLGGFPGEREDDYPGYIYNVSETLISWSKDAIGEQIVYWIGNSQFYTQLNDGLYFVPGQQSERLFKYNLTSMQLDKPATEIDPTGIYADSCLASTMHGEEEWLMILSSMDDKSAIFYHINAADGDTQWFQNTMQEQRSKASCVVHDHDNRLYAIAGIFKPNAIQTIESFDLSHLEHPNSIEQSEWTIVASSGVQVLFPSNGYRSRAVSFYQYIMVISGDNVTDVHLFDTISKNVTKTGSLNHGVTASSVIIVENMVYSFGDQYLETLTFPTPSPTQAPTQSPVISTKRPTKSPVRSAKESSDDSTTGLIAVILFGCAVVISLIIAGIYRCWPMSNETDSLDSQMNDDEIKILINESSDGQPPLNPKSSADIKKSMADNRRSVRKLRRN